MSLLVTFNGSNYIIPETNEVGWGSNLDAYFIAIAAGCLQKTGGLFTLSAETDFGASFGLKSLYYSSRTSGIATAGVLRLANNSDAIVWRNNLGSANIALAVNTSDQLTFDGTPIGGSGIFTASRAIISAGSGNLTVSPTTSTEIGYVSGVTSAIQTQLNLKAPLASPTFTGNVGINGTDANRSLFVKLASGTGSTLKLEQDLTGDPFGGGRIGPAGPLVYWHNTGTSAAGDELIVVNGSMDDTTGAEHEVFEWDTVLVDPVSATMTSRAILQLMHVGRTFLDGQGIFSVSPVGDVTHHGSVLRWGPGEQATATSPNIGGGYVWSWGAADAGISAGVQPTAYNTYVSRATDTVFLDLGLSTDGVFKVAAANGLIPGASYTPSYSLLVSATAVTIPYLGANLALVSGASSAITTSSTTATELGYVSGVTSAIQTQLNAKATDSLVVHLAGTETITGAKTFLGTLTVNDGGSPKVLIQSTSGTVTSSELRIFDTGGNGLDLQVLGSGVVGTINGRSAASAIELGAGSASNLFLNVATGKVLSIGVNNTEVGFFDATSLHLPTALEVASGGTGRSTLAAHGIVIGNGTSGVNVSTAGSAGQVLTSNGASADPTFQNVAGTGTVDSGTAGRLALYNTSTNEVGDTWVSTGNSHVAIAAQSGGHTYTIPDALADASFVMTESAQTINGAKTLSSVLTITPTTNQLVLGVTRTATISAVQPATTSRTYTFPDLAGNYNVVGDSGTQTIGGSKTFSSAVNISATTNQLVLSTTSNTLTIAAAAQAISARTWTIPDISGNGTFAALEGTQTFSGAKTFSAEVTALDLVLTGANTGAVINSSQSSSTEIFYRLSNTNATSTANATLFLTAATSGGNAGTRYTTGTTAWKEGSDAADSSKFKISQNTEFGTNDYLTINATTKAVSIHGTNTTDSASAGFVGEYISSLITVDTNFPTSTQWGDLTSISLTAGDWDVTGLVWAASGSGVTITSMGISSTSGNSTTGLSVGDTRTDFLPPTATSNSTGVCPAVRVSISGTTTYYLKYQSTYSVTAPVAHGRISARRIR